MGFLELIFSSHPIIPAEKLQPEDDFWRVLLELRLELNASQFCVVCGYWLFYLRLAGGVV